MTIGFINYLFFNGLVNKEMGDTCSICCVAGYLCLGLYLLKPETALKAQAVIDLVTQGSVKGINIFTIEIVIGPILKK